MSFENIQNEGWDWCRGYYNAVEFYHWEPELLNRVSVAGIRKIKSGKKTADEILKKLDTKSGSCRRTMDKIKRTEEPFNHILELFTRLSPKSIFDKLAQYSNLGVFQNEPRVITRKFEYTYKNATQPDLLLFTPEQSLFIEVKPPHGYSSPEQFAKYCYAMLLVESDYPAIVSTLLYLANGNVQENFRKNSMESLRVASIAWVDNCKKGEIKNLNKQDRIKLIHKIKSTDITFLDFGSFLKLIKPCFGKSETEQKLLKGIECEIIRRGYLQ